MILMLDTHIMLWAVADTKKLTRKIKNLITDSDNRVIVSAISFWEVSLKYSVGKLEIAGFLPDDLPSACVGMGFEIEPLSAEDCCSYHQLKATYHKDPFDRMLIWQAIRNRYTLLTVDEHVKKYASDGLLLVE